MRSTTAAASPPGDVEVPAPLAPFQKVARAAKLPVQMRRGGETWMVGS